MADSTLSALTGASALSGAEFLYLVQGGADRKGTAAQIAAYVGGTLAIVASSGAYADLSGKPALGALAALNSAAIGSNVSGLGTGVATALAVNIGSPGAPVVLNGVGGTPSSLTLTNAMGLPLTTGVTGTLGVANGGTGLGALGTGVQTALGNATGAAGGLLIFSGAFGTPTSLTLTNATGLPVAGISATGTPSSTTYLRGDGSWATPAGGGGTPGGSAGQLQYNSAGAFAGLSGTSWDDTNRSLTLTGATVTTSNPVLNLSQTWNAGAVTFTGLKFNVTNTASATSSMLLDFQVGGSSKLNINAAGTITVPFGNKPYITDGYSYIGTNGSTLIIAANSNLISTSATASFQAVQSFSIGNGALSSPDVFLYRDAANTFAQRNGTSAQTFRAYNTYTDASNYERGVFDWLTTANVFTIGTQNAGTGNARYLKLTSATKAIQYDTTTVASLPAAATAGAGARAFVTDATATTFGSAVAGSGANKVPVWCDGTNWLIG